MDYPQMNLVNIIINTNPRPNRNQTNLRAATIHSKAKRLNKYLLNPMASSFLTLKKK